MKDNEIMKALECCQTQYNRNCAECPYEKYKKSYISTVTCESEMRKDLLDFINRQNIEIKCIYAYDGEVEEYCVQSPCSNYKTVEQIRQEVAREIFEEIEDVLNNIGYFDEIDFKALKNKYTESEGKG